MKPEILAFSLLPWVIYYSKQYLIEKDFFYLYFTIPMLSILFTSKGSILGLTVIFLLLFYGKEILNIFKNHTVKGLTVLLILIAFLIPIYMENSKITNSGVLNFEPYLEYKNNAPLNIIYNFDLNEFLNNPIRNSQAGSFIGVTLLDTFGDYYQLYWEYEYSLTNTSRKEILKSGTFNIDLNFKEIYLPINIRYLNLEYYRIYISVLLTLIYYLFLLKDVISKKYNKELKVFLILPFIGMALLLFQVITGVPAQNWDPSKGDSLKPFYYSFLIIISFSFLFIENLKKIKFKNKIFLIISSFLVFMFLMGFPKANNSSFDNQLIFNNQHLFTCEMNSLIFKVTLFETDNITCKKNYEIFCDESLFTRGEIKMLRNEKVKNVNSVKLCKELFEENYQYESTAIKLINTPIINLLYFLLSLLVMSYSMMRAFLRKK